MLEQFFGKTFRLGLAVIVGAFGISILAYVFDLALPFLLFAGLIVMVFTARHPSVGLMVVFLELFSNPHGHLIFSDNFEFTISLRMAIFVGFFLGYAFFLIRTKSVPHILFPFPPFGGTPPTAVASPAFRRDPANGGGFFLLPLALSILLGFLNGFLFQNPADAFNDGNGYFFLLYAIPVLGHTFSHTQRMIFFQILAAGAVWNIVTTLGILYLFTHFDESVLRSSYVFLRDIRLAEITNIGSGFYRVFIQSQFYVIALGALLAPLCLQLTRKRERIWTSLVLGGVIATFLLSLSRSFWVGAVAALFALFLLMIRSKSGSSAWRQTGISFFLSLLFGMGFIALVSFFPFPSQRLGAGDLAEAFSKRADTDVAISSRWQLLDPMKQTIRAHPIIGSGFGTSVSFITDDPRVREIKPDGVWTTQAMEWGWFELWLKMGILGPISLLILLGFLVHQFSGYLKTDQRWIGIGFISALVFLFVTHAFSPYLNHPIGLGFLLFTLLFLPSITVRLPIPESLRALPHIRTETPEPASALSLRVGEE